MHKSFVLHSSLHYVQCVPYTSIVQIFLLFIMICKVEFNRLPCPDNEKCDDAVFADIFRYQLTMFGIRVLLGVSPFLHAHIAYEKDNSKIIAEFCRIS